MKHLSRAANSGEWLAPLLIFALALGVRLWYLHQLPANPTFDCPIMDADYHDRWARQIAGGDWIGHEVFFRAPLYPYFLGLLYRLFGPSYVLVRLVQFALGALTCVLTYLLGKKTCGQTAGVVAGVMAAFYGPMIFYDGELLLPVLETLLGTGLLVCVVEGLQQKRGREASGWWLLGGLCLGLFAVTRPNIVAFVPVLAVYLVLALGWRRGGLASATVVLVTVLCIAPVTIRNWAVGHDFVPISSQAGVNLYIGNNPQSDGVTAVVPGTRATWWGGYRDTINLAEQAAGRKLKPSEVSAYWTGRALQFARTEPLAWLKLTGRKVLLLLYGHELPNNEELYAARWYTPLLRPLIWRWGPLRFPFGLLAPLALVGMGLATWRRQRELAPVTLYVLAYAATIVAFFVCARYRIPIVPALLVLAAYAVVEAVALARARRWQPLAVMTGLCVALALPANHDFFNKGNIDLEKAHIDAAFCYAARDRNVEAEREYRAAMAADPTRPEPQIGLANLLVKVKRFAGAQQLYQGVLRREPHRWEALVGMGNVLAAQGRREQAVPYYRQAIRVDPEGTEAYAALAACLRAMGRDGEATEVLAAAPAGAAGAELVQQQQAELAYARGDNEQTVALCRRVLQSNPDYAPAQALMAAALLNLGQTQAAAQAAQRALKQQPDNAAALTVLAKCLVQAQQMPQAEALLRRAVAKDPKLGDAWQLLGICRAMQGDPAGAIEPCRKALQLNPGDEQARFVLAGCHMELKQYAAATAQCRELLRRNPGSERGQRLLAQIARLSGRAAAGR